MRRREFITLLGSVAAWPIGVRAQQLTAVIGFLRPTKAEESGIWLLRFVKASVSQAIHLKNL
jgi:hypothetical protein